MILDWFVALSLRSIETLAGPLFLDKLRGINFLYFSIVIVKIGVALGC